MKIKHAFMFAVYKDNVPTYKVAIASHTDMEAANTRWMDNPELPHHDETNHRNNDGTYCLSIDITESIHTFDSFDKAEQFLVEHYAKQRMKYEYPPNLPIAELLAEYAAENCDFTNMDAVVRVAQRYVQTMPDEHIRCLLHVLAEHVASQKYETLVEHFNEVCDTRDRFVKITCDLRKELAALKGLPDPYGNEIY